MNWGKKLIIGMALFMIFIVSLGAIMIMRNGDDALIENDYYEKGQSFSKDYQLKQNAIDDKVTPKVVVNRSGATIEFPVPVTYKLVCKRPSDYHMDRMLNGLAEPSSSIQLTGAQLKPGPWLVELRYSADGKSYLFETQIDML